MVKSLSRIDFNLFRLSFLPANPNLTNPKLIRHKLIAFEGLTKPSKINSVIKRWSKRVSMVIAKTAGRNVAFKAAKLGDAIFELLSDILMTEAAMVNSPSREEDLGDVGCNADFYAFKQDALQGCSSHERS